MAATQELTWEYSCGAVVFTRTAKGLRFVLAESKSGKYGFPKGHMEAGESERDTALREIWEEVHLRPEILEGFRRETTYALPSKKNTWKKVTFFLAEYRDQEIIPQAAELRSAPLLTYSEAMAALSHGQNREILKEAMAFLKERTGWTAGD